MKLKHLAAAISLGICALTSPVSAADTPTCVLMKFTDDTRYEKIESAPSLSDLVMEKLLATGKINFKETQYIDKDMEYMLYEERATEFKNAEYAVRNNNFNVLFEGAGYNGEKAQSIVTAQVGQIISPSITSAIGRQHGAEYLIQGTIRNLGTGDWMDMTVNNAIGYAQTATSLLSFLGASGGTALSALGPVGMLAGLASSVQTKVTGVAVQADLRLIKAETGEVVWKKMVTGKETQKKYTAFGVVSVGSDKLNNEMYAEAMNNAAEAIANAIIEDIDAGKLFAAE
jgi:hypothetical protein